MCVAKMISIYTSNFTAHIHHFSQQVFVFHTEITKPIHNSNLTRVRVRKVSLSSRMLSNYVYCWTTLTDFNDGRSKRTLVACCSAALGSPWKQLKDGARCPFHTFCTGSAVLKTQMHVLAYTHT